MTLAHAHNTTLHGPNDLWLAWTLDPFVLVPLALAVLMYGRGVRAAWRRAGVSRGVRRWEVASFATGALALFLALVWPLDVLGELLFSAHMAQHLLLTNVAAPLLVLGSPMQVMIRTLPLDWRHALGALVRTPAWRSAWRSLTGLTVATTLQQLVLWGWHTPRTVAAALEDDWIHIAMHASLLVAALVFWTAVSRPRGRRYWAAIAALFATLKASGLVCIVLLLAPGVRYPAYGDKAAAWGLSPVADEQIGWGLMMIAGTTTYLAAAVALSFLLLERRGEAARLTG